MNIIIAIITSVIASLVFYILFDRIPFCLRYRKMRPLVEENIKWIEFYLIQYLQCAVLHSRFTASFFQSKISEGTMTAEEYKTFLNTKCLNESYRFDERGKKLMVVGDKLQKNTNEVLKRIEYAYKYSDFTRIDEFIILEEISKCVTKYEYEGNALTIMGNNVIYPANLSLYYMANNFFELNGLLMELHNKIVEFNYLKRNELQRYFDIIYKYKNRKMITCMELKQLDKCYRLFFYFYKNYREQKREKAAIFFEKFLYECKLPLVTLRNMVEIDENDTPFMEIMRKVRGNRETDEMIELLKKEQDFMSKQYQEALRIQEQNSLLEKNSKNDV